ncbi:MAG: ATP-binding protein [Alphaproteobacteria bacterium]
MAVLVPFALLGALAIAVVTTITIGRRARRAEDRVAALEASARLEAAVSVVRGEQVILWTTDTGAETASAGMGALLGLEEARDGWYAALHDLLEPTDAEALRRAVEVLRAERRAFDISVRTNDGARTLVVRGDCVAAEDGTATFLTVADRSVDAARIDRLGAESQRMHALVDALPLPVWLRDTELGLVHVNRAYRDAVEADEDMAIGDLPEIAAGIGPTGGRTIAARARAAQAPQHEQRHIVIDGTRRLVDLVESPLPATGGGVGFAIDQTRVEEIQEELKRYVGGHEVILQNLGTAIAIYGPDQSLQFFNNAFLRLWDLDEAWLRAAPRMGEVLEKLRELRRLPEHADFPAFKNDQLRLFTTLIEPAEEMIHLPDGKTLRSVALPHPFGGLLLLWEDVTDALALERNYNTLIAVQRETLDNLFEGVAVIGANGRLRLSNPAFGNMWRVSAYELANEPHISEIVEHMADLLGRGENWADEKQQLIGELTDREPRNGRIERADGVVLDFASMPLPDGAVLLSYLDVTAAINMERALRERNEALEMADQLKSEFIANVSYELRTPLNTIIGFTEILTGQYFGDLNERQAEYGHGILDSSNRLLLLINDILDLATIEAGHMSLELESIDLNELLHGVIGLVSERARQKHLRLECDCAPDIGMIVADERRLKQALFNLLSNAVKFTPEGGEVVMSARRRDGMVLLTTSDSGIGISAEDRDRVFDKFERGSNAEARRAGAGLGLPLVRSFIEMHGGRVELESEPDRGTRVTCILPARANPPKPAETA